MATSNATSKVPSIVAGKLSLLSVPVSIGAVRARGQPSSTPRAIAAIAPVPDGGDLDFSPVPVDFTQSFSDIVGNYGTQQDGWESLLSDMELSIGSDAQGLDDTISILDDITDTSFDGFQASTFDPITQTLGDASSSGDAALAQYGTDIIPPGNQPPPAPAPPGGSGSGSGGTDCSNVNCFADPTNACCQDILPPTPGEPPQQEPA